MGQLMWVRMLTGNSTEDAKWRCGYCRSGNRDSRGKHLRVIPDMKVRFKGKDYMPLLSIYLKWLW
jgi:hypothetical protein